MPSVDSWPALWPSLSFFLRASSSVTTVISSPPTQKNNNRKILYPRENRRQHNPCHHDQTRKGPKTKTKCPRSNKQTDERFQRPQNGPDDVSPQRDCWTAPEATEIAFSFLDTADNKLPPTNRANPGNSQSNERMPGKCKVCGGGNQRRNCQPQPKPKQKRQLVIGVVNMLGTKTETKKKPHLCFVL